MGEKSEILGVGGDFVPTNTYSSVTFPSWLSNNEIDSFKTLDIFLRTVTLSPQMNHRLLLVQTSDKRFKRNLPHTFRVRGLSRFKQVYQPERTRRSKLPFPGSFLLPAPRFGEMKP